MRGVPRARRAISCAAVRGDLRLENRRRAVHDPRELDFGVEIQVMEDPEALAQRRREHAGARRRRDEREGPERVLERAGVEPLVDDEVDGEVFHRRIQKLLDGARQPVDLVDEEDVLLAEVRQDPHQVGAPLDGRAGGRHQGRAHLVGQDPGERRLAEPGRAVEQHVVHALLPHLRCVHRHAQARDGLLLADVLLERARPQLALELRLFGRRGAAQDLSVVRRGGHHAFCPR